MTTRDRVLLVLAHPVRESYCAALADAVQTTLVQRNYDVDVIDLYADDFDPRLTAAERSVYLTHEYDASAVENYVARLREATKLVLVFPQWWFGFPAILKGFIDRVIVPGVGFDHGAQLGEFIPRLGHISALWAVMTAGSPWWTTKLYMGDPVRRLLKRVIIPSCMGSAAFRMLTYYHMDRSTPEKRAKFLNRVTREFHKF